ncbi:MAG: 4-(cytidine 5'-diphospho)-2-C-methyl-D-erythritol kinase, partial [Pseudolabrys sp.]|nr:4-(cytidine 5'-diphospho)-2-C-methyl-D-erythritol kinase [Pseudolabrys sp.]
LTEAATAQLPVIDEILMALMAEPGCRVARMSGSGATCFGLFETQPGAQAAADKIRAAQPQWWVYAGVVR